jgi:hypothetical protein
MDRSVRKKEEYYNFTEKPGGLLSERDKSAD